MKNNIATLIDKYFEEQTSLAEEQVIKDYFAKGEVAEEFQMYASIFQHLNETEIPAMSADFDSRLLMHTNISDLLDKYFEDKTSLEEEQTLRDYFTGGDVAQEFKAFQPMFEHFSTAKIPAMSADFDARLAEALAAAKPEAKVVSFRKRFMRVAAAAAIILGAFTVFQMTQIEELKTDNTLILAQGEIDDPELAYEQTQKALEFLAKKLSKNSKKAAVGVKHVGKASKIIQKN